MQKKKFGNSSQVRICLGFFKDLISKIWKNCIKNHQIINEICNFKILAFKVQKLRVCFRTNRQLTKSHHKHTIKTEGILNDCNFEWKVKSYIFKEYFRLI